MVFGQFNNTQNKDIIMHVMDYLKLNPITDAIPSSIIPTIQPVFEVKAPYCQLIKTGFLNNATSTTIYTTPTDKDFYIDGIFLAYTKDANATTTYLGVQGYINSTLTSLAFYALTTLTAGTNAIYLPYNKSIKIDRGTQINGIASTNVANFTLNCYVFGHFE